MELPRGDFEIHCQILLTAQLLSYISYCLLNILQKAPPLVL